MADSLAMPIFPYIFVFVLTGIVAFQTKRGDLASFSGTISSALLYLIYSYWIKMQVIGLVALAGVMALLTALAVWEMQFRNKKHEDLGIGYV